MDFSLVFALSPTYGFHRFRGVSFRRLADRPGTERFAVVTAAHYWKIGDRCSYSVDCNRFCLIEGSSLMTLLQDGNMFRHECVITDCGWVDRRALSKTISRAVLDRSGCEIMDTEIMTAGQFAETRYEMPEGGRWHELHAGRPQLMEAPNDEHGTVVLNLSRALAEWFKTRNSDICGYAAHDVGLLVGIDPDTVLMPALSYFDEGERFGQSDLVIANVVPRLVVDISSSNDRRQLMRERTLMYLNHGVESVWLPDPSKREVQVLERGSHTLALGERQSLANENLLPGFELSVQDLFAQPSWWK